MTLTEAQKAEIVRKYRAGSSLNQLGTEYGVVAKTVHNLLIKRNVPRRGRGNTERVLTDEQVAAAGTLWLSGKSQNAIGLELGVSQPVVGRYLRAAGFKKETRHAKGSRHGGWKGGRVKVGGGYVGLYLEPDDPFYSMTNRAGYAMEHRVVMARRLGRPLTKKETVHHINGVRNDNRDENLQLRSGHHGSGVALRCRTCGSSDIVAAPFD